MKEQQIDISDTQLYELIAHDYVRSTNDDGSIILIVVEKKISEDTFPDQKWLNRLKRFFICRLIGHDEVGVYSWISYCQRCNYSWNPSELCSQCKKRYSSEDDE